MSESAQIRERAACTKETPYRRELDPDKTQQWVHAFAESVYDGDYYESFECPICGLYFKVEIAQ